MTRRRKAVVTAIPGGVCIAFPGWRRRRRRRNFRALLNAEIRCWAWSRLHARQPRRRPAVRPPSRPPKRPPRPKRAPWSPEGQGDA